MKGNVTAINTEKKFPLSAELFERIESLIHEYEGELGVAEAIGVLEMVKQNLLLSP